MEIQNGNRHVKKRLQLLVGERWPDGVSVEEVSYTSKQRPDKPPLGVAIGLTALFGILLAVLTVYAMVTGDEQTLSSVFQLVQYGLVASVSWCFGRWGPATEVATHDQKS